MAKYDDFVEQAFWDFDADRKKSGMERDAFKRQMGLLRGQACQLADDLRYTMALLAGADLHREDAIRLGVIRYRIAADYPVRELK